MNNETKKQWNIEFLPSPDSETPDLIYLDGPWDDDSNCDFIVSDFVEDCTDCGKDHEGIEVMAPIVRIVCPVSNANALADALIVAAQSLKDTANGSKDFKEVKFNSPLASA